MISRRTLLIGSGVALLSSQSLAEDTSKKPLADSGAVTPSVPKLTLTEQLLHATVLLECTDAFGNITSSGTGFFFSFFNHGGTSVLALITNKHVVNGAHDAFVTLTVKKADGTADFGNNKRFKLSELTTGSIAHPDSKVDLIAFAVGTPLQKLADAGENYMFVTCDASMIPTAEALKGFTPLEETLVIGYPDGISDTSNNIPVFRRGVTATPIYLDFKGEPYFLLDAAIFPGSSGSPVFLYNQGTWLHRDGNIQLGSRAALIGVVFAVFNHTTDGKIVMLPAPTQLIPSVKTMMPNNLGVCVKAEKILDFEPLIAKAGATVPDGYTMRSKLSP